MPITTAPFPSIHTIRGVKVILNSDLAQLYGVPTKRLLEQMRRNAGRFPEDFAFRLRHVEYVVLRSQIATLKTGRGQHRKYLPFVFTEHGALQAANVINSPQAAQMSIYVVRAFIRMRKELATSVVILKRLAKIDKKLLMHDVVLRDVYRKLQPLLAPPPEPPKRRIGFHLGNYCPQSSSVFTLES
jgi:hypothetical protein